MPENYAMAKRFSHSLRRDGTFPIIVNLDLEQNGVLFSCSEPDGLAYN